MKNINFFSAFLVLSFIGIGTSCNNQAGNENSEAYEATEEWKDKREGNARYDVEEYRKFAMEAASDGMVEIRLSEMAIEKASNTQVKELAQMIRTDHQAANGRLMEIMQINGWNLPTRMMKKHEDQVKELRKVSDQEFDQEYLTMMVEDHQRAIEKLEKAANGHTGMGDLTDSRGEHRQLKTWINETLPVLHKHLERSKELQVK